VRYVCIHGHFYQPPRENPWLEVVELEDSAYPYHDWNERITAECYGPNAWSRILDARGRITRIVNNYAWISFDFGPTLLWWLEQAAPEVYQAILEADRQGRQRFGGHGPAIAHPYHHVILPLANERDRRTELLWGIRDFTYRFGRRPEGIWLPETAVDLATLEVVAELGITFTILAPHQAAAVRPPGFSGWQDVSGGRVETTRPYRVTLPSGRELVVFFYDGAIARDVAFGDLLQDGRRLAARLLAAASDTVDRLAHIATDGETYGHHHRFGDMALAAAIAALRAERDARVVTYGAYLAAHPATWEAQIVEETSWSCAHGIERWRSNCGCQTGAHPGWTQEWRAPLRAALDWLRDTIAPLYERHLGRCSAIPGLLATITSKSCSTAPRTTSGASWSAGRCARSSRKNRFASWKLWNSSGTRSACTAAMPGFSTNCPGWRQSKPCSRQRALFRSPRNSFRFRSSRNSSSGWHRLPAISRSTRMAAVSGSDWCVQRESSWPTWQRTMP
jgi:alpha-amylase/alpha-mannosidase (GH57 family)